MATKITDYALYRWRYPLGYGVLGSVILGVLVVTWLYIPGGLSLDELNSTVKSGALPTLLRNLDPTAAINLPYHLIQYLSIKLFGLTPLSIKLPSLLLSLFSALGLILLLRNWFRHNVAVITTVLVISTGSFMFLAQNGTPATLAIFWPVWLLVSALMVSRRAAWAPFWKLLLLFLAGLSLYTPFGIYVFLALGSAGVLHPHLRYLVGQFAKTRLMVGLLITLLIIAPLIYAIVMQPSVGLELLGVPATWPNLTDNAVQLARLYLDFVTPSSGLILTPVYGLGTILLIVLGVVRLATMKYTARSYVVTAWLILLVPLVVIQPAYHSITFIPIVLLIALGVSLLISRWYGLFPRNPYARAIGLIPLAILIGGMVLSGFDRYTYGYLYDPRTAVHFSDDLKLLNTQLGDPNRGTTVIVTTPGQTSFYSLVMQSHKDVTLAQTAQATPAATTTIVTHDAWHLEPHKDPWRIVASSASQESDRFYIYKTPAN